MNTAQLLKVVVGLAIAYVLYMVIAQRRGSRGRWNVQPYEPYEDEEHEEGYEGYGGDEADEYEADEYEDDTDAGYEAYAEAEDEATDMGDEVETYANAVPAQWGSGGRMNVATDLLPKPTYEAQNFSEFAPKSLLGQNFLDAKKYIGVDTQGSSLRNASRDIRSTPVIPRRNVGPWLQSTIESDLLRKPLE